MKDKEMKQTNAQKLKVDRKKSKKDEKLINNPNAIRVLALDGEGGNYKYIAEFVATRFVEPSTKSTYIKNDDLDFMIPYPELEDLSNNTSIASISKKMSEIEETLKQEMMEDSEEINEKDLIKEYKSLKKKLRGLLFSSNTSLFGSKLGNDFLIVLRKGASWYPLSVDKDTSVIHTISNARNTITRTLESNKRTKYGALSNLTTLGVIFLVATFLMFAGGMYSWYKAYEVQNDIFEQSTYIELVKECKQGIVDSSEQIKQGVIEGVSASIIQHQTQNDPIGTGSNGGN